MLDNVKHSCRPQRITYQLIHRSANLHQGESVLIHGAAGGAGTARAATRLARQVENVRHRIQAQARSGGCSRALMGVLWPLLLLLLAWYLYNRLSPDVPAVLAATCALTFAWVLVAPWSRPGTPRWRG